MTANIPRMARPGETLGEFLRRHRKPLGWDRVEKATGLEERRLRNYELGRMPQLNVGLLFGEALGIPLEDLAEAALGRPYDPRNPPDSPEIEISAEGNGLPDPALAIERSGARASSRAAAKGSQQPRKQQRPPS